MDDGIVPYKVNDLDNENYLKGKQPGQWYGQTLRDKWYGQRCDHAKKGKQLERQFDMTLGGKQHGQKCDHT